MKISPKRVKEYLRNIRTMKKDTTSYVRGTTIVLMASVAAFSIMSGVGTTCVAFWPDRWGEAFAPIIPYAWIYQIIVVVTLLVGFAASMTTYAFVRGEKWAYWGSIVTILIGIASGGTHMYYSSMLRGSATPANMRVYLDIITLLFLLIIRMPGIWNKVDWDRPKKGQGSYNIPMGAAFLAAGLGLLSTPLYATPSHTFDGVNYIDFLFTEILVVGSILTVAGLGLFVLAKFGIDIKSLLIAAWDKTVGLLIHGGDGRLKETR